MSLPLLASPDLPAGLPLAASLIDQVLTMVVAYHWVILAFVFHLVVLGSVAYLILLERKTASWVQDRIGPNRVGLDFGLPFLPKFHFWGLGQPLADGLKFLVKEDYQRKGVDAVLFSLAPLSMIVVVIISIAVIPWGGVRQVSTTIDVGDAITTEMLTDSGRLGFLSAEAESALRFYLPYDAQFVEPVLPQDVRIVQSDPTTGRIVRAEVPLTYRYHFQIAVLNIGVLFVLAALSLAVYGVVIGGWASNNKYSFLGGLRATANMISYEIPLGMSVLVVIIMFGTLDLAALVDRQATYWWVLGFIPVPAWNLFAQPLAFLLFLICIHAEANRAPFDMAEAEQELVGGYHTEYSSMRFALFFLAEYAGMITTSCVLVALFWGGWHLPYADWLIQAVYPHRVFDPATNSVTTSIFINVLNAAVLFGKAMFVMFIFMWVRWSLPRFRFDQLMQIAWKGLIPIMLLLVIATTFMVWFTGGRTFDGLTGMQAAGFLLMNVVVMTLIVIGSYVLPAGSGQNTKVAISDSRFGDTPLPAGVRNTKLPTRAGTGSTGGPSPSAPNLVTYSPDA